jgi:hypothetical protein
VSNEIEEDMNEQKMNSKKAQRQTHRMTTDFSTETLKARRAWNNVIQTLKENNYQSRLLYPAKLSFIIEGEIKIFHENKN